MLMGMLYQTNSVSAHKCAGMVRVYFISAWASALLVSTDKAMPEPQSVGRVTVQIPALFFLLTQAFGLGNLRVLTYENYKDWSWNKQ